MLVKSIQAKDHLRHLDEMFSIQRKYKMKLNSNKCMFKVSSSKFLGYMFNQRRVKANLDKIRAVLEMAFLKTVKDVQRLVGRLTALSMIILKAIDRNIPFHKILNNAKTFEWTDECEMAITNFKIYLSNPSFLSNPKPKEELFFT